MIEIINISKKFANFIALDNISFTAKDGEILGFLGPNGAGKTTTMRILTGFFTPDKGTIKINNLEFDENNSLVIKKQIGYLPEGSPLYKDMKVISFLNFIADIRQLKGQYRKQSINKVIRELELEAVLIKNINDLSKGFKRRVGLAQAIIHDPKVIILDEPTDGLDPNQKHQVIRLIKNLAKKNKTIIISTHILEEVKKLCSKVVLIVSGKIVTEGSTPELLNQSEYKDYIEIIVNQDLTKQSDKITKAFSEIKHIENIQIKGTKILILSKKSKNDTIKEVLNLAKKNNLDIITINVKPNDLEHTFRKLTLNINEHEN